MFNFSLPELFVIFVVAFLVLGPKRLPELGRALGKAIAELQRSLQGVREQMDAEVSQANKEDKTGPKPENKNSEADPEKSHASGGPETPHTHDSAHGEQRDSSYKDHS